MAKRKSKYTIRSDGRIVLTETFPNGERKYFYGKTDRECEQKRDAYAATLAMAALPHVRTFEEIADAWWEEKQKEISPNTLNGYRVAVRRCTEEFGALPVDQITAQQIYEFLKRFSAKGYSYKVISNTKTILGLILDQAFISGDVSRNVCRDTPMVKGKTAQRREPASDDDIKLLEAHKTDSLIARLHYFILYTGCRRGEAIALQWKNVDLKNKVAHIVQNIAWGDATTPILKQPKTAAGFRDVFLPQNVLDILPAPGSPDQFVFYPDGLPHRGSVEKSFKKFQQEIGISGTAHQLRHSYASLLHSAGVDVKDAQVLLGHSTIAMTQDIYTHLEAKHRQSVGKNLDKYIKKNRTK